MNLFEHEGKKLLANGGIAIPRAHLLRDHSSIPDMTYPVFAKAQILSGGRMDSGGIALASNAQELTQVIRKFLGSKIKGWTVADILAEEKVPHDGAEYFISFSCDPKTRTILFTMSDKGGTGIEERPPTSISLDADDPQFPKMPIPEQVLRKLFDVFRTNDCILLEVNPLVLARDTNEWTALDAKIVLDDSAFSRHPEFNFPERPTAPHHKVSPRELAAKAIDKGDHRGTAGSTYLDLDGDIAMLPSGGGASLTAMDALFRLGGKPANYTEYSGNPTGEKVKRLVSVVVSKPDLSALWVVGAIANFTDIAETLRGLIEGLQHARKELDLPIDYPIVIRRAGPRDREAYAMLREVKDFDLHVFGEETSIEESAQKVITLSRQYKNEKTHTK